MKSSFLSNHLGPRMNQRDEMLKTIRVKDVEEMIFKTVPDDIRLKKGLELDAALSESEYLEHINACLDQKIKYSITSLDMAITIHLFLL